MLTPRTRLWLPTALTVLCFTLGTALAQRSPFVVGSLTCQIDPGTSTDTTEVGEGRDVLCHFRPGTRGPEETYIGTIHAVGQVKTVFGKGTIMLAVRSPIAGDATPGMLAQGYSAEATRAIGGSALLIGDKNKALLLQPILDTEGRVAAGKSNVPEAAIIGIELRLLASAA